MVLIAPVGLRGAHGLWGQQRFRCKPWGRPHPVGVGWQVRRPGLARLQDMLAGELLCVEEIYGLHCICGCPERVSRRLRGTQA